MSRTKLPRVRVVEDLRTLKNFTAQMIARWAVTGKVYVSREDREPGSNLYLRDRLPEEYPGNSRQDWQRLADDACALSDAWDRMSKLAQEEADKR